MAGPLTWRNVDAPDAYTAMQGLRQMSDSLSRAFTGGSDALGAFKDQRAAAADQAGLAASLKFTDPAQYQEALRNGLIPQENMTAEGTANLGNRATQLLNQQSLGQDFKVGEQNLLKGDQALLKGTQELRAGDQLYKQRDVAASTLAHRFERQLRDEKRTDTAYDDNLFAQQTGLGITNLTQDPASAMTRFNAIKGTMTPSQERATRAYLETAYKVPFTGMGSPEEDIPMDSQGMPLDQSGAAPYSTGPGARYHEAQFGAESGHQQFDPKTGKTLTSPKGAQGYGQIMPKTGPEAAALAGVPYDADRLANDKDYNKLLSVAYSNEMFKQFDNDPVLALSAYNAGQGNVRKAMAKAGDPRVTGDYDAFFKALPKEEETRPYVEKTIANSPAPAVTQSEAEQLTATAKPKVPMTRAEQMQAQYDMPVTRGDGTVLAPQGQEVNGNSPQESVGSLFDVFSDQVTLPRTALSYAGNVVADQLGNLGNYLIDAEPTPDTYSAQAKEELIRSYKSATDNESSKANLRSLLGVKKREDVQAVAPTNPAAELTQAANPATNGNAVPVGPNTVPSTKAIAAKVLDQQDTLMRDQVQSGVAQDYIQNLGNTDTAGAVVAELQKGDFAGTDTTDMLKQINFIVDSTGVNFKTAGAAMTRAMTGAGFWSPLNKLHINEQTHSNNLGGGKRLDDKKLSFMIDALKNNASLSQSYDQTQQKTGTTTLAGARDALTKANEALTRVRARFANGMTDDAEVMRYEYRQQAAERALAAAL